MIFVSLLDIVKKNYAQLETCQIISNVYTKGVTRSATEESGLKRLIKGRTIRKVIGGGEGRGGEFSACTNFFFLLTACAGIFFQVKPSARIFFFRQILLFFSVKSQFII